MTSGDFPWPCWIAMLGINDGKTDEPWTSICVAWVKTLVPSEPQNSW